MELIAQFGLFNGILVLVLIMGYSFFRTANKIFLGLSLLSVWYSLLIVWLNETGLILQFPLLQRTGLIAGYLAVPFLLIYGRNTFYPGRLWWKTDWILFLPAVIYIIDFMPFFLLPPEKKTAIWRENLDSFNRMFLAREGWLGSSGFHFVFLYVWIVVITFLQFRLIARNWNLKVGFRGVHNRRLLYFIGMITILYMPLFIPGIFGVIFKPVWFNSRFIGSTYGLSLSAVAFYLLIYPNILYGFLPETKFFRPADVQTPIQEPSSSQPSAEYANDKKARIETAEIFETGTTSSDQHQADPEASAELAVLNELMIKEKPFRQQGFTIQDLSNQTGIPVYQLSPLINQHFKKNFTSWVNHHRIRYFLEHAVENQHMTLEALANDAGFTSRSSFINSFKKEKGMTPREYLRNLQSPE